MYNEEEKKLAIGYFEKLINKTYLGKVRDSRINMSQNMDNNWMNQNNQNNNMNNNQQMNFEEMQKQQRLKELDDLF